MHSEQALTIAGLAATWAALAVGTWKLFEIADKGASKKMSEYVTAWLKKETDEPISQSLAIAFSKSMEAVYGRRIVSLNAFARSILTSLFWMIILTASNGINALQHIDEVFVNLLIVLAIGVVTNLIPDYLSIVKTRYFVLLAKRSTALGWDVIYLFSDLLISIVLGISGYILLTFVVVSIQGRPLQWPHIPELLILLFNGEEKNGVQLQVWFFATLLSSIWLWLYYLSSLIARAGQSIGWLRQLLKLGTNIDDHPFLSIGFVALGVELIGFCIFAIFTTLR